MNTVVVLPRNSIIRKNVICVTETKLCGTPPGSSQNPHRTVGGFHQTIVTQHVQGTYQVGLVGRQPAHQLRKEGARSRGVLLRTSHHPAVGAQNATRWESPLGRCAFEENSDWFLKMSLMHDQGL